MNTPIAPLISWPTAPTDVRLDRNEVHVRAISLAASTEELAGFAATLAADEKERAARFKFDLHRKRFIAGRGQLRAILGCYLTTDPAQLDFTYSSNGKPGLARPADPAIHFNLAHSDDLALLAVTRVGPVGIDVEHIRPMKDADGLVARFFSARENELFQKLSADEKPVAFFNLWTRKEALLKATGEGITGSLNQIEVSFRVGEPARLLAVEGDAKKAAEWSLRELSPAAGFVGAVAIRTREIQVRCHKTGD